MLSRGSSGAMPGLPPPPSQEPADGTPKPEGKRGAKVAPAADFTVEPEELCSFVERAIGLKGSVDALERDFNGIMGLAHTLRVNPALGLVRRRAARSRRPLAPPARPPLAGRPRCRAADPRDPAVWDRADERAGPRVTVPSLRQQHAREGARPCPWPVRRHGCSVACA